MLTTREEKKEKAIEFMQKLKILPNYIQAFKKNDTVCLFQGFGGYWLYQYPELQEQLKKIEEKYDCVVYAVMQEHVGTDECYSFLVVTDYKEEWERLVYKVQNNHCAFAYVWNKDIEYFSEFGRIFVQSLGGGIRRVVQYASIYCTAKIFYAR